jgi:hypothetical protein
LQVVLLHKSVLSIISAADETNAKGLFWNSMYVDPIITFGTHKFQPVILQLYKGKSVHV